MPNRHNDDFTPMVVTFGLAALIVQLAWWAFVVWVVVEVLKHFGVIG